MSAPRSKRYAASVASPRLFDVLRMEAGLKYALSRRTLVVSAVTSVLAPPMTPARAIALSGSAMRSMESVSSRSWPSSVVRRSPGRARRTMIFRWASVSESKAWSGWPSSQST